MGICGAKPVKPGDGPQAAAQSAPPEPTFTDEQVKALHSTIRWSKPLEDIKKMIAACPDLINASDKGNGNTAIHLACQNGHFATVNYLIAEKAAVDAQNDTGNTALHMAVEYKFYWVITALKEAKADPTIKNKAGHPAEWGIDGNKKEMNYTAAISSATSAQQIFDGFELVKTHMSTTKKSDFVMAYMTTKKLQIGKLWTTEMTMRFQDIVKTNRTGWADDV